MLSKEEIKICGMWEYYDQHGRFPFEKESKRLLHKCQLRKKEE